MPHRTGLLNPKSKEYTWHTTYTNTIKGLRAISYLRYSVRTQEWRVSRDHRRPTAGRWFWLLPRARDAQAHRAQPIGGGSTTRSLAESHVTAVKKAIAAARGKGRTWSRTRKPISWIDARDDKSAATCLTCFLGSNFIWGHRKDIVYLLLSRGPCWRRGPCSAEQLEPPQGRAWS